jgi:glutamine phosphoribosylpyrophosphate amidotransferase
MCEQFVAHSATPFRLADLWPFAERLERYGIAGFGWGVAWLASDGSLGTHRDTGSFAADPHLARIGAVETTACLVHLRRPSKLSTTHLPDTQPFADPDGRFAFGHNGDLREHIRMRARYVEQGRIRGRADTEVAARWLEDEWRADEEPATLLSGLHDAFGGEANFALLLPDGSVHHYAGNEENPVFSFRLGGIRVASTALYSIDRSLFQIVAPDARDRHLVRRHTTASLA